MFVLFWNLAGDSDAVLSRVMQNFSYWETVNTSQQVEARLDSGPSLIRFKIWPSCCFYISSAARVRCPTLFKSRGVVYANHWIVECKQQIYTRFIRSRPNWITGPGPKSGSAGKSGLRGPENGVSAATELGYLLTKLSFGLSLSHDMSISWQGGKEL